MNVEQFAQELKLPPQLLLEQLKAAGVTKQDAADDVTEADKAHLLDYLRKMHGGGAETGKTKITITRKQTGEIRKTDSTGKSRTIQVEVRKKRTYVKREVGAAAEAPLVEEVAAPVQAAPVVEEMAQPAPEPVVEAAVAAPVPEPVAEAPAAEAVEARRVKVLYLARTLRVLDFHKGHFRGSWWAAAAVERPRRSRQPCEKPRRPSTTI